jgi:hypothetical protein
VNTGGSGAVTEQRDGGWVSAELLDILLDPLEGGYLVHEAVVGHPGVLVGGSVRVQEP